MVDVVVSVVIGVMVDVVLNVMVSVVIGVMVSVVVSVVANSLIYNLSQNQYRFYLYKMRVVKTGRVVLLPIF